MVLLNSEVPCKNGQEGIYSLAVIIVYASVTVFISSIYNNSINHYPWEWDLDFQVSVWEVKFLFMERGLGSNGVRRVLDPSATYSFFSRVVNVSFDHICHPLLTIAR